MSRCYPSLIFVVRHIQQECVKVLINVQVVGFGRLNDTHDDRACICAVNRVMEQEVFPGCCVRLCPPFRCVVGDLTSSIQICEAPVPDTVSKTERVVTINFKYTDGGLMLRGDKVGGLQVFDGEKELVQNADYLAKVQGSSLTIESLTDSRIEKVAFARTPYYTVNLFNMAGIPAKPFEID